MVPEADQFPKKPASPSHPSLSRADPSAGLALQGFTRGFHPRPCSHLRSLKERDPQSTRLSTTTARKLPEETNPSPASPSWASNTWWGELAPASLAAVFVAEPASLPGHAKPGLHPCGFTQREQGSQPLRRPSSLAARSRPHRELGVGEAEGAGEEGRRGGGRKRRFSFLEALRAGRRLPSHPLSYSSPPSHLDRAFQGLLRVLDESRKRTSVS